MKKFTKILAVLMSVALLSTLCAAMFVGAETVAVGTEYTVKADETTTPFTYGIIRRGGINEDLYFADAKIADLKPLSVEEAKDGGAIRYCESATQTGDSEILEYKADGKIWCRSDASSVKVITFTAPVAGNYKISFDLISFWRGGVWFSIGNNDLKTEFMPDGNPINAKFIKIVALDAGQTVNIGLSRAYGNATVGGDTVEVAAENLKVTVLSTTKGIYDFKETFGAQGSAFSAASRALTDGAEAVPSTTFSDGTDGVLCAASEKAMVGYCSGTYVRESDGKTIAHNAIFYSADDASKVIKWYPSGGAENIVVFTAPATGKYTFDFVGSMLWNVPESMGTRAEYPSRYYVESNGQIVEGCDKKIEEDGIKVEFSKEVTLLQGQTIYFVYNPEKGADGSYNSSHDNGVINSLVVYRSGDVANAPVNPTPNPNTSDIAVSIAVAIAAAAVVGVAVLKKH